MSGKEKPEDLFFKRLSDQNGSEKPKIYRLQLNDPSQMTRLDKTFETDVESSQTTTY